MSENDRYAQSLGFRDAAQLLGWHRHRSESLRRPQSPEPGMGNFLGELGVGQQQEQQEPSGASLMYPPALFEWLSRKIRGATSR